MRRLGWTLLLPSAALVSGALAASCGDNGGYPGNVWSGGTSGTGTNGAGGTGGGSSGGGTSGDGDAGATGGGPSAWPDAGAPLTDGSVPLPPGLFGEAGVAPDAASCSIGPSGPLGLIPGGTMSPGLACVSCHVATGAGKLNIAGTVYPTYHEPDLCLGTPSGVQVIITDAQGADHTISVNTSGNFYDNSLFGFSTPYKARVVSASGSVAMLTPQTNGDCNVCHTVAGTQGAAGRIVGP